MLDRENKSPGVSQELTAGKPNGIALVSGDVPMDTQREVKIIIAATVMFLDDTHTEFSLLLTRFVANGQA